jgi:hypothetical protein
MKTWRERIAEALTRGKFTATDWHDAHDYRTCAVGEHHQAMPLVVRYSEEHDGGIPMDHILQDLGWKFFWNAVSQNNPILADSLLDQIEDQVLWLKREASS